MNFRANDNLYVIVENLRKNDSGGINGLIRKLIVFDSQGNRLDNKCFTSEIEGDRETVKGDFIRKIYVTDNDEIYMRKADGTIEVYDIFLNGKGKWETAQYRDICLDEADNLILLYTNNTSSTVEKIDPRRNNTIYKVEMAHNDSP
ncbi:hypothetical protein [Lutispora thermophila]|uniref:Uncharacterized protein n=1 Tax=Lutispora thermophila DSM 19022 TaxID=1122184 RepID=A0A1M6DMG4_9FIRM|nr:hypothetical protein [Lutispora thermophila]SHI74360.1 hypothetical protein SAMN02745176_01184 [Lutispora thermophila DSM 19022]